MKREIPLPHQLYAHLYPNPTTTDPPTFAAHLARNLVPEVRVEVSTFFGDLNTSESRYPGLNYCRPAHRLRLGRFEHHKRLFDAFDELALTDKEIQEFCCWEGTKWARERYEKDEGVRVVDTTGAEIGPYVDRREQREMASERRRRSITKTTSISVVLEEAGVLANTSREQLAAQDEEMSNAEPEEEEIDENRDNVGHDGNEAEVEESQEPPHEAAARQQHISELSRRREEAINRRILAALQQGRSLSPDIEQYLKEQSERGALGSVLQRAMGRGLLDGSVMPSTATASLAAATTGLRRDAAARP